MNLHLILETVRRWLIPSTKTVDPWDVLLKTLDSLDPNIFINVSRSELCVEFLSVTHNNIEAYRGYVQRITHYIQQNRLIPESERYIELRDVAVSNWYIDTQGRHVNPIQSTTLLIRALREFIQTLQGANRELANVRNLEMTGRLQQNVRTLIHHLEEVSTILSDLSWG